MTAVNWLFPPLSLTPDFPCMLSNLNCAVIAHVAFLMLVIFTIEFDLITFAPWLNSQSLTLVGIILSGMLTKEAEQSDSCTLLLGAQSEKKA